MLVVETIARIRREHFVKGKTIREIARDLGVSRNTVRRVLRSGETSFEYERDRPTATEARAMDGCCKTMPPNPLEATFSVSSNVSTVCRHTDAMFWLGPLLVRQGDPDQLA
jgi:IS30 family transposase